MIRIKKFGSQSHCDALIRSELIVMPVLVRSVYVFVYASPIHNVFVDHVMHVVDRIQWYVEILLEIGLNLLIPLFIA